MIASLFFTALLSFIISVIFSTFTKRTVYKYKVETILNGMDSGPLDQKSRNFITELSVSRYFRSDEVRSKLIKAGYYNEVIHRYYLPAKAFTWVAVISILSLLMNSIHTIVYSSIVSLIVIVIFPDIYLSLREKSIIKSIERDLPYLIDMTAMNVKSGMTIEAALIYLEDDVSKFNEHLAYHLSEINSVTRTIGLPKALANFSSSVDNRYIKSFTFTLTQSVKFGSSIYDILIDLAEDIRATSNLELEEKIGKLSAKMSIPLILLIMMPIVILIIAPGLMRLMYGVA